MDQDPNPPAMRPPIRWRLLRGVDRRGEHRSFFEGFGALRGVGGPSPDAVIVVGEEGMILRSRDKGESWDVLAGPRVEGRHCWHSIWSDRSGDIYIGGDDGVARSSDAGETWETCLAGPIHA